MRPTILACREILPDTWLLRFGTTMQRPRSLAKPVRRQAAEGDDRSEAPTRSNCQVPIEQVIDNRVATFSTSCLRRGPCCFNQEAEQHAPAMFRDGYDRAIAAGNPALRKAYRTAMLRVHVLRLLQEPIRLQLDPRRITRTIGRLRQSTLWLLPRDGSDSIPSRHSRETHVSVKLVLIGRPKSVVDAISMGRHARQTPISHRS